MRTSVVLGVCGGSGSGKSTFSDHLVRRLGGHRVTIFPLDAYYVDLGAVPAEDRTEVNFDHPDAIDVDLLIEHLDRLRNGESIESPVYDFAAHTRSSATVRLDPAPILLVEGILSLHFDEIFARLDMSVFLDVPSDLRLARRVSRDVVERGRVASDVEAVFRSVVDPMHGLFVEPCKARADHVIGFEDDPADVVDRLLETVSDPVLQPA